MTTLLSLDGVSKRFRGLVAVDRLGGDVSARRREHILCERAD
jgi:hypothetical protein